MVRRAVEQARTDQERRDRFARPTKTIVLDRAAGFLSDASDISRESMAHGIHAAFAQMIAQKQLEGVAPSTETILRWLTEREEGAEGPFDY